MKVVETLEQPLLRPTLSPGWPIWALFVCAPLWWLLGLTGFISLVLAAPIALALAIRSRILVPRGFGVWLLFLGWVLLSASQLDSVDRTLGFAYRTSLYLSATAFFLYVFNASRSELPGEKVVGWLCTFWAFLVLAGVVGVVFPHVSFASPAEALMPSRLLENDFVRDLVHVRFAQVHDFLGFPIPRPSAPFAYTNDWGAVYGLLLPLVLLNWSETNNVRRGILSVLVLTSFVPVIMSMNRWLWLTTAGGLLYASTKLVTRFRPQALVGVLVMIATAAGLLLLSPAGDLVGQRFDTPHSNRTRLELYRETTSRALDSPLLGYGAPRPSEDPSKPSVGTQGQLWMVLFSHGIFGTLFFLSWLALAVWRTRKPHTTLELWCHVVILTALMQMPFYDFFPLAIHIVVIAMALALREEVARRGTGAAELSRAATTKGSLVAP